MHCVHFNNLLWYKPVKVCIVNFIIHYRHRHQNPAFEYTIGVDSKRIKSSYQLHVYSEKNADVNIKFGYHEGKH